MKARIYVQTKNVEEPMFVILYEDGRLVMSPYVAIDGPSELVSDVGLGKLIVLTQSPLRLTPDR
jgi:hypothetical protein